MIYKKIYIQYIYLGGIWARWQVQPSCPLADRSCSRWPDSGYSQRRVSHWHRSSRSWSRRPPGGHPRWTEGQLQVVAENLAELGIAQIFCEHAPARNHWHGCKLPPSTHWKMYKHGSTLSSTVQ